MINAILNVIILVGIVVDFMYTRRLEEDNKVLKEWIKFCYHVDLDRLTEFVEKNKDEPQNDARICTTCKHNPWVSKACQECKGGICDNYEPQTERSE